MQTVEKQVVLEENWQVLAVVFPPFAQRLENSVSRACWPSSLGVFHSSQGSATAADYIDKLWEKRRTRFHLPIYRMTRKNIVIQFDGRARSKYGFEIVQFLKREGIENVFFLP